MTRTSESIYEELLVMRCQDGESDAFEELYARWQPRVLRHAMHLTARPEAAKDVVQEAWLAVVKGLKRLEDPTRFRSWAYRIVGNKSADWVRETQRRRKLQAGVSEEAKASSAEVRNEDEDMARLRTALKQLPGESQAVLSMHYLESMGVREIAHSLGIPSGTVKSRLYHAREQLRNALKG